MNCKIEQQMRDAKESTLTDADWIKIGNLIDKKLSRLERSIKYSDSKYNQE